MEKKEQILVDVELIDSIINQLTTLKELIEIDLEPPFTHGYETFMDNAEIYYITVKRLEELRMLKTLHLLDKCKQSNGKE